VSPIQACLLSGGASRRMGRDKALLTHPQGGCWLEGQLRMLAQLGHPLCLLSAHASHRRLAAALAPSLAVPLELLDEPPPREGPLRALARLMAHFPDQRLLLCPVDMPWLTAAEPQALLAASHHQPQRLQLAHDGCRPQPLLGIYPGTAERRQDLERSLAGGERRLQAWLAQHPHDLVPLDPGRMRNCNHPQDWPGLG